MAKKNQLAKPKKDENLHRQKKTENRQHQFTWYLMPVCDPYALNDTLIRTGQEGNAIDPGEKKITLKTMVCVWGLLVSTHSHVIYIYPTKGKRRNDPEWKGEKNESREDTPLLWLRLTIFLQGNDSNSIWDDMEGEKEGERGGGKAAKNDRKGGIRRRREWERGGNGRMKGCGKGRGLWVRKREGGAVWWGGLDCVRGEREVSASHQY